MRIKYLISKLYILCSIFYILSDIMPNYTAEVKIYRSGEENNILYEEQFDFSDADDFYTVVDDISKDLSGVLYSEDFLGEMEAGTYHWVERFPSSQFDSSTFRNISLRSKRYPEGTKIIVGKRKSTGQSETQAILIPKGVMSETDAKILVSKNGQYSVRIRDSGKDVKKPSGSRGKVPFDAVKKPAAKKKEKSVSYKKVDGKSYKFIGNKKYVRVPETSNRKGYWRIVKNSIISDKIQDKFATVAVATSFIMGALYFADKKYNFIDKLKK
jgi:hypothetical protein